MLDSVQGLDEHAEIVVHLPVHQVVEVVARLLAVHLKAWVAEPRCYREVVAQHLVVPRDASPQWVLVHQLLHDDYEAPYRYENGIGDCALWQNLPCCQSSN